jgi:DNA repair exonuclease SbcCD ATPase subunit
MQTTKIRELEDSNKDSTTLIKSLQEKINELEESRSQNEKELERAQVQLKEQTTDLISLKERFSTDTSGMEAKHGKKLLALQKQIDDYKKESASKSEQLKQMHKINSELSTTQEQQVASYLAKIEDINKQWDGRLHEVRKEGQEKIGSIQSAHINEIKIINEKMSLKDEQISDINDKLKCANMKSESDQSACEKELCFYKENYIGKDEHAQLIKQLCLRQEQEQAISLANIRKEAEEQLCVRLRERQSEIDAQRVKEVNMLKQTYDESDKKLYCLMQEYKVGYDAISSKYEELIKASKLNELEIANKEEANLSLKQELEALKIKDYTLNNTVAQATAKHSEITTENAKLQQQIQSLMCKNNQYEEIIQRLTSKIKSLESQLEQEATKFQNLQEIGKHAKLIASQQSNEYKAVAMDNAQALDSCNKKMKEYEEEVLNLQNSLSKAKEKSTRITL